MNAMIMTFIILKPFIGNSIRANFTLKLFAFVYFKCKQISSSKYDHRSGNTLFIIRIDSHEIICLFVELFHVYNFFFT